MANNWSIGGRTRHIEVREYFLQELKEQNIILTKWISSQENEADTLTKNLPKKEFLAKNESYVGEILLIHETNSQLSVKLNLQGRVSHSINWNGSPHNLNACNR